MSSKLAHSDDGKPALCGYLMKQGAKGPIRGWKKRWFTIAKGSQFIEYFRYPKDTEPLGRIDVLSVSVAEPCPNNLGLRKDRGEFAFQYKTPGRTYFLQANGENIVNYWINGIRDIRAQLSPKSSESSSSLGGSGGGSPGAASDSQLASFNDAPSLLFTPPPNGSDNFTDGQLLVKILEAESLPVNAMGGQTGVYCVITFDKQLVKTQVATNFNSIQWNESFFFDITRDDFNKNMVLSVSVWVQDMSRNGGSFLGLIYVPIVPLFNQPITQQSFPLRASDGSEGTVRGKLQISLSFTSSAAEQKVGYDDFEWLRLIGKGNFGKVVQVRKKDTGRIYAMKILRKDTVIAADAVQHTLSESNVLRRINHPFIVNLKYSFQTEDKLFMVMDYLSGGELFYHLSNVDRFDEDRARFYAAQIILALHYLHLNGIVYRDLKPENLLLDISGHVCLTDFGLVKEGLHFGEVTHTFCGSPEYLAPEILQNKGYGKEVDWWALGTFLYEMLDGLPPFYDENVAEMNRRILSAPLYFSEHFTTEAKSLLRGLLQRNPKLRLGSGKDDGREIMAHPFFKNIDWARLSRKEIEPAFKPHLQSAEDVRYFDPQFTTQTPTDSYVETQIGEKNQNLFVGFSYVSNPLENIVRQRRRMNSDARSRPPTSLQINDASGIPHPSPASSSSSQPPIPSNLSVPQPSDSSSTSSSSSSDAPPPSDAPAGGLSLLTAALKKGGI